MAGILEWEGLEGKHAEPWMAICCPCSLHTMSLFALSSSRSRLLWIVDQEYNGQLGVDLGCYLVIVE